MTVKYPRKIDLMHFLKTGEFDCVQLGQTKSWILDNFPLPDEQYSPRNDEFEILSYGAVELHFREGVLYLIFSDYINQKKDKKAFDTGKSLKFINQSFFGKKGKSLLFPYIVNSLIEEKVNYSAQWKKNGFDAVEVVTQGGINLLFEDPKNDSDNVKLYQLAAISLYSNKYAAHN